MALCKCGINGGKHLFRDCPDKDKQGAAEKDAAKKKDKKALAAQSNQSELIAALQTLVANSASTETVIDEDRATECDQE